MTDAKIDVLIAESVMEALADLGEDSFAEEKDAEGLLLGSDGFPPRVLSVGKEGDEGTKLGWFTVSDRGTGLDNDEAVRRSKDFEEG